MSAWFRPIVVVCTVIAMCSPVTAETAEERPLSARERDHWAYLPITDPAVPTASPGTWAHHPIDRFLKAAMEGHGVGPMPRAGKATLLRRLTFDLIGLPPRPDEVLAFISDSSVEAYDKCVDRLLDSPMYGARWAQHWLDLARFAETDGFEHDLVRPHAWRYRDWVVDAFNRDLPFDEFVRLQVAGDELAPDDPQSAVATGFLLCGPDMPDLNLQDERRHLVLNEMTATVGSVFLALQLGCAQCHDHKYDPIRQHDFYRMRGFFNSADIFREHPIPTKEQLAELATAEADLDPAIRQRRERRSELESLGRKRFAEKNPDVYPSLKQLLAELPADQQREHVTLTRLSREEPRLPELPAGRVLRQGAQRPSHLYLRGDFRQPGPTVEAAFPRVLVNEAPVDAVAQGHPRVALARWLTSAENPLVSRVFVNRLWQWHFGVGLAASTSDFGLMGSEPTNGPLLDWLARSLMTDGWSIKRMHRLIVTSQAYQAASGPFDLDWSATETAAAARLWKRSQQADPENRLFWHHSARLDGESIRDAMLLNSDSLSTRRGGPGIRPPLPEEVAATLLKDQWEVSGDDEDRRRRSIYLFVRRNLRWPLFDVFDRPDAIASCAIRHESTTATQSLTQFNSSFTFDCAQRMSGVLLTSQGNDLDRCVGEAYLRAFGRRGTSEEVRAAVRFVKEQAKKLETEGRTAAELSLPTADGLTAGQPFERAALVQFCLALLNANEFLYVE